MEIQKNILLKSVTTLAVGGPARYFCRAGTVPEIQEALSFARENNVSVFVIGGGSNILVGDKGFAGLVLKVELRGMQFELIDDGHVRASFFAGEAWDSAVATTVARGISGLENLSGIPGTVGGAVVGNIGAYGKEVKDTLEYVEVMDIQTGKVSRLSKSVCAFGYRQSFFKTPPGRFYIVLSASFLLSMDAHCDIVYKELAAKFAGQTTVSSVQVRAAVLSIRASKLPDWHVLPTAGSFFKNPVISAAHYKELQEKFSGVPGYEVAGGIKLSAAYLIDKIAGLRGAREGEVGTFEKQALVIVNFGGASASDIDMFANRIAHEVKVRTNIFLEREVESVGEF